MFLNLRISDGFSISPSLRHAATTSLPTLASPSSALRLRRPSSSDLSHTALGTVPIAHHIPLMLIAIRRLHVVPPSSKTGIKQINKTAIPPVYPMAMPNAEILAVVRAMACL